MYLCVFRVVYIREFLCLLYLAAAAAADSLDCGWSRDCTTRTWDASEVFSISFRGGYRHICEQNIINIVMKEDARKLAYCEIAARFQRRRSI